MKKKLTRLLIISSLLVISSLNAVAQEKKPRTEGPMAPTEGTFKVLGAKPSTAHVVKGAPYSATATTETVQILTDGNQISRKNESKFYRDSEGRTRMEQTLGTIGKWAANGEARQLIAIHDPVAGVSYSLDPSARTAYKMGAVMPGEKDPTAVLKKRASAEEAEEKVMKKPSQLPSEATKSENAKGGFSIENQADGSKTYKVSGQSVSKAEFKAFAELSGKKPHPLALEGTKPRPVKEDGGADSRRKTESLGKQMVEGVEVELTRTTLTIPAGEIGNSLPIEVVDETWYSPELQVVVMSKHRDPRTGETTYRLTNLNRSEPSRSLFEIPADYSVVENKMPPKRQPTKEEQ